MFAKLDTEKVGSKEVESILIEQKQNSDVYRVESKKGSTGNYHTI